MFLPLSSNQSTRIIEYHPFFPTLLLTPGGMLPTPLISLEGGSEKQVEKNYGTSFWEFGGNLRLSVSKNIHLRATRRATLELFGIEAVGHLLESKSTHKISIIFPALYISKNDIQPLLH